MKLLVTGASGLVGNNVVRQALAAGNQVRVLLRPSSARKTVAGLDVEIVAGDLRDAASVTGACQGMDAVIHAAAMVQFGWTGASEMHSVNAQGTAQVAIAARQAGARLIHVSSVDALGVGSPGQPADEQTPPTGKIPCPYVVTKGAAERVVLQEIDRGLDAVIVNPGFMLGPWDWKPSSGRMLLAVATRFTPVSPSGGVSVCDVRDVAAGVLTALGRGECGRRYILAGTNMTYFDLWCLLADVSGGRRPWGPIGPIAAWVAGRAGDVLAQTTGREPDVNSAGISMGALWHYYSSRRAETELGYQFRPPQESAAAAWQWLCDQGYARAR